MNLSEIDITKYAAKTQFEFHNVFVPVAKQDILPIGIDVGYSTTKVYSAYGRHIFPSFPIQVNKPENILLLKDTDIQYEDAETGTWFIGDLARRELENGRIAAQPETLYGWQRIHSREYLVLLRIGIFFGLVQDIVDGKYVIDRNKQIVICTGLPQQYLNRDKNSLKQKFIGHHNFKITIGKNPTVDVSFDIRPDDIYVISQPFGTLWAITTDNQGIIRNRDILFSRFLIFDGGYHTADTFFNKEGLEGLSTTWETISMHSIQERARQDISRQTGGEAVYPIYMTDKYLTSKIPGQVIYGMRKNINIKESLIRSTEIVAKQALEELSTVYNNLNDINTLICSGGLGHLFYQYFKEYFALIGTDGNNKEFEYALNVLLAERTNDQDPTNNFESVMANAYGFYVYLVLRLKDKYGETHKVAKKKVPAVSEQEQSKLLDTMGDKDTE